LKVNCAKSKKVCRGAKIRCYPTLLIYMDGNGWETFSLSWST